MDTNSVSEMFQLTTSRLNKWRNVNVGLLPWLDYYKYIRGIWLTHEYIMPSDLDFLTHVAKHELQDLKHTAYVLGEWIDITPSQPEYYNLTNTIRPKAVKKCKPLKLMR